MIVRLGATALETRDCRAVLGREHGIAQRRATPTEAMELTQSMQTRTDGRLLAESYLGATAAREPAVLGPARGRRRW
ncbi:hypothetical protein [Acidimicrobium ferrooxidans]|uniref:hypothetical protein n=1 Tax=Acidimicrobium ferrooxidans TaxID=53635 RepID=UPI00019DE3D6|nr:hypothetical protein [Acidimicrobium ferrooxidans]